VEVHRAGYYQLLAPVVPDQQELELRSQIQAVALEWLAYGYRRVAPRVVGQVRLSREPQTRVAHHAGRQPAVSAAQGLLAADH